MQLSLYKPAVDFNHRPKEIERPAGGKMDKTTITVLSVVGSFGVLSAILGFAAESTKLIRCYRYPPTNPSLGLGVCAALFLIIAQVVFAVVGGCCGTCKSSEANRTNGVICAVGSWIAAVTAFVLFVAGASYDTGYDSRGHCWVLKPGIFAGGALLALAATALGLTSYVLLRRLRAAAAAPSTGGGEQLPATPNTGQGGQLPAAAAPVITIAQPQFPQQPSPQGSGQAPPPKFLQQPQPQGYGQAPLPKFLQKPRPKYPQPSAPPHGQGKANHAYDVDLRVDDPQLEYQNGGGIADLHERQAQTSGGEHYISDLPKGEAEAHGGEYSLHSPE